MRLGLDRTQMQREGKFTHSTWVRHSPSPASSGLGRNYTTGFLGPPTCKWQTMLSSNPPGIRTCIPGGRRNEGLRAQAREIKAIQRMKGQAWREARTWGSVACTDERGPSSLGLWDQPLRASGSVILICPTSPSIRCWKTWGEFIFCQIGN